MATPDPYSAASAAEYCSVTLVDAHHHFWDLSRNYYPWLSDRPHADFFMGDYSALKHDFLPADYRRVSANHNVLKTVHVEAEWDRSDQVGETRWLTQLNQRYGLPSAIVAHAWFDADDTEEILAAQASFPLVRGIRSKPVTSAAPGLQTPGAPGTMQDPRWLAGFSLLEKYQLSWDMRVPPWHLQEAAEVARLFPNIRMVLNHTGFPWDRSERGLELWRRGMEAVARHANVCLKISEFGLKGQPWGYVSNRIVVHDALSIFGVERCMFASDAPVSGLRIAFDPLVRALKSMVAHLEPQQQKLFFVKNAEDFYRL